MLCQLGETGIGLVLRTACGIWWVFAVAFSFSKHTRYNIYHMKNPPSAVAKHPMYRNPFPSSVQGSKYLAFFSVLLLSITLTSHIYMSSQHSCSKISINSAHFTLYYFCFLSNCHWFKEMWPIISHVWNHSSNNWPVNQIPLAIYKLAVPVRFLTVIAGQLLGWSLRNSPPNSGNFILSVRRMVNLQF